MVDMNLLEICSLVTISMTITLGSIDSLSAQSGTDTGSCSAASSWLDVILIALNAVLVMFMLGKLAFGKRCQCGKAPTDTSDREQTPLAQKSISSKKISALMFSSGNSNGEDKEVELQEVGGMALPDAPPRPGASTYASAVPAAVFMEDMDALVDATRVEQQADHLRSARIGKHAQSVHNLDLR
jgi:hypothetical protein